MRHLRILVMAAAMFFTGIGVEAQSLWVTLRPYAQKEQLVIDSITPGGDTLSHHETVADSSRREPLMPASLTKGADINTAGFEMVFKPVEHPITFKSQYTAEARRDSLLAKRGSTGVSLQTDDPFGRTPLESARYNYMISNPSKVKYTWSEVPSPWEEIRDGKKKESVGTDSKSLSRLFTPDSDLRTGELVKEKEKEKSPWTLSGQENLQFSQLALSNWIKGGENSASLLHDLRMKLLFSKGRSQWETNMTSKLGFTYTSELGTRITSDELNIDSKYGFNAVNKWYYSTQTTLKTQLFQNYSGSKDSKTLKSTFFSPAYLQFIFGMDYKRDNLSLLLSPYTAIITIVADTADIDQTKYGIEADRKSKTVNGFSVTLNWKKQIIYGVNYTTKVELFYEYFKKDGNKRFDWENILDVQINRYLSTRFLLELRYYDNESEKFQIKENFSVAFKYSF